MLKFRLAFVSSVVSLLAATGSALAQEPAAAEPAAPPPGAQPAPVAQAAPAPAAAEPVAAAEPAAPEAAPAAVGAEEVAPVEGGDAAPSEIGADVAPGAAPTSETEEEASVPGWFRIDSDGLGLQLWAGATHDVGGLAIASDIYVGTLGGSSYGEFDIGPAFTVADGALTITPMLGILFNWEQKRAGSLVPQLFLVGGAGPLYFESWWQAFMNSVFIEDASNILYTRHFVTFSLTEHVAIGPEVEPTFGLNNDQDTVVSMPLGGVLKLNYGQDNTLLAFLGYEMIDDARQLAVGEDPMTGAPIFEERALAGRLTFVKNW